MKPNITLNFLHFFSEKYNVLKVKHYVGQVALVGQEMFS